MRRYSGELMTRLRRVERYKSEMGADELFFELKPHTHFNCLALIGSDDIRLFNTEEDATDFLETLRNSGKSIILVRDPWRSMDNDPVYKSMKIIDMRKK